MHRDFYAQECGFSASTQFHIYGSICAGRLICACGTSDRAAARQLAPRIEPPSALAFGSGDTHGHYPASLLLWPHPTPADAFTSQASQVRDATFQTRSASLPLRLGSLEPRAPLARRLCPSMPRHAFRAANRLRRFFSASRNRTRWPHGFRISRLNGKGSRTLLQLCFAKLLATLVGEPDALRRRCIALRLIRL